MSIKLSNQMSKACICDKMVSAGVDHVIHGVGAIVMFLITEAIVIYEIVTADVGVWIAVALIMQVVAIYFIHYAIKHLAPLSRKVEFMVCFSKLEDVIDISRIRENYNVLLIDDYGVVFTDLKNQIAINDWLLVNKGTPTKTIEKHIGSVDSEEPDALRIKSIQCLEVRKFYDSTWQIEFANGECCKIIRDDLETEENLRESIKHFTTVEEIEANLDMRNKIYYD